MRFEATDKKIQANLDEIRSTAGRLEEYHSEFLLTARNLEAEFTEDPDGHREPYNGSLYLRY